MARSGCMSDAASDSPVMHPGTETEPCDGMPYKYAPHSVVVRLGQIALLIGSIERDVRLIHQEICHLDTSPKDTLGRLVPRCQKHLRGPDAPEHSPILLGWLHQAAEIVDVRNGIFHSTLVHRFDSGTLTPYL